MMVLLVASQVLIFGGGLTAEWLGGTFSNNTANMGVAVINGSTFTTDRAMFDRNIVRQGAIYGECSVGNYVFTWCCTWSLPCEPPHFTS